MLLKLKKFIVTTPLAKPLEQISSTVKRKIKTFQHPELDLFMRDDDFLDRVLADLIKPDSHCIDVGCHIGSMLKRFHDLAPQGQHMAVEPTPTKAAWLKQSFPKAKIFECALAEETGTATFYEDLDRPGYSTLLKRGDKQSNLHAYDVEIKTLDEITLDLTKIDLIKIDVEGAELRVLKGGSRAIAKHKPVLVFECGPVANEDHAEFSGDAIYDYLTQTLNYDIYAAIDCVFERPPLALNEFRRYRIYPFVALNFIAMPRA